MAMCLLSTELKIQILISPNSNLAHLFHLVCQKHKVPKRILIKKANKDYTCTPKELYDKNKGTIFGQ